MLERSAALDAAVERYVQPGARYRKLGLDHFTHPAPPERGQMLRALADDAQHISDAELDLLFGHEWRSQLTAAWLVAVDRRVQFEERAAQALLASRVAYAGQGYCLALTQFADVQVFVDYLDEFLPRTGLRYDQHWVFGALLHLDPGLAAPFVEGGRWQRWAAAHSSIDADPDIYRRTIARALAEVSAAVGQRDS